ncbi:MAG: hypothetical protein KAY09_00525 [Nitrospira sp.]|nr:hypothetical protein [Nitrospira sp.]
MPSPFPQFTRLYPEALKQVAACLSNSKLPILEEIALRFCYALENKTLDLKNGDERLFLSDLLSKTTSEMFAMIGTMRNGALIPAYHHTRSILELYSALEHIYCVPAKQERKLKKYIEFKNVAKYLHYRKRKHLLTDGQITSQDFSDSCPISKEEFDELQKCVPAWIRIWKLRQQGPEVIQYWHYPATIQGLFESSDSTKTFWTSYESICHATHLSPLGSGLTTGNLLIGFPKSENGYDYKKINYPIICSIVAARAITNFLHTTVTAGTIEGVLKYGINDLHN